MIFNALRWAWSFLSPWLGPLVTRLAPGLVAAWPGIRLKPALRGLALAALACAVAWGTWRLVRREPDPEPMVAVSVVEAQRFKAENESLKAALARANETLRDRERQADLADQYIEALKSEKEALRALSTNPDAPVFAADDPWLLGRR